MYMQIIQISLCLITVNRALVYLDSCYEQLMCNSALNYDLDDTLHQKTEIHCNGTFLFNIYTITNMHIINISDYL